MPSTYAGIGVSNGVAAGPVARVHGPVLPPRDGAPIDVDAETDRRSTRSTRSAASSRRWRSGPVRPARCWSARRGSPATRRWPRSSAQLVSSGRAAPRAAWEAFGAYRDMRAADPMRAVPDRVELDDIRDRVVARLLGEPPPGHPGPGYAVRPRRARPLAGGDRRARPAAGPGDRHRARRADQPHRRARQGARDPGRRRLPRGRVAAQRPAGPRRRRRRQVTADPDAEALVRSAAPEGAGAATPAAVRARAAPGTAGRCG